MKRDIAMSNVLWEVTVPVISKAVILFHDISARESIQWNIPMILLAMIYFRDTPQSESKQ